MLKDSSELQAKILVFNTFENFITRTEEELSARNYISDAE
jgi:hypothetical protein